MESIQHFIIVYLFAGTYCGNIHNVTNIITEVYTDQVNASAITPFLPGLIEYHTVRYTENLIIDLRLLDMEFYLLQNQTLEFLSSFKPGFQRDVITEQLRFCPYTKLCGFSFGFVPPWISMPCCNECSCNFPACISNMTCCPDVIFNHINMYDNTLDTKELLERLMGQNVQKDCILLSLRKHIGLSKTSAFGYATCPSSTEKELLTNCTRSYDVNYLITLSDTTPVVSKITDELYRNKYCAFCNGELEGQIESLNILLKCSEAIVFSSDKDILQAIYVDDKCEIDFSSENDLERCDTAISSCNVSGTFEATMCSIYRSVIYIDNIPYKNTFCAICNGDFPDQLTCLMHRIDDVSQYYSFSGILKLENSEAILENNFDVSDMCSENQLYDYTKGLCRDMECSSIYSLKNGVCVDLFEVLQKITFTTYLRLTPVENLPLPKAFNAADQVIDKMRDFLNESQLCGVQMMYTSDYLLNESHLSGIENSSLLYFDSRFQYYVEYYSDPNYILDTIMNIHGSKKSIRMNSNETITFSIQVRDDNPRKFDMVSFLSRSDKINNGAYHYREDTKRLNLTFLIQNYIFSEKNSLATFPHLRQNDDVGWCNTLKTSLDVLKNTKCPKVSINKLDTLWEEADNNLFLLGGKFIIKSNEYYYLDETNVMICVDKYKEYMKHISLFKESRHLSVESIVSIVCTLLSILALCCTFFVFCFFSKLRESIPGKNNLSLTLTLLLAQTLYLVGSFSGLERNSTECIVFGILTHFSWLVALFWMNICTFHMFRVLSRTKVISRLSGTRKLAFYHVYALLMASIFVSVNIGLSHKRSDDIGYGGSSCYISSQNMIIYTFGIPVALIIISNICMFTYVIIKIKRSPSVQKNVQNERNDIIVFAKLSTITGATWIFGFLYTWTNLSFMSYIFILLNASQGVFIMFAFVVNKRVFDLFRGKVLGLTITSTEGRNLTSKSSVYTTKP